MNMHNPEDSQEPEIGGEGTGSPISPTPAEIAEWTEQYLVQPPVKKIERDDILDDAREIFKQNLSTANTPEDICLALDSLANSMHPDSVDGKDPSFYTSRGVIKKSHLTTISDAIRSKIPVAQWNDEQMTALNQVKNSHGAFAGKFNKKVA
jgi:hypothetical protein